MQTLISRRTLFPILMSLVVLSPLAIDIYLPAMPTMALEYGVNDSQIQSTLMIFLFAMGLGQILIGPLADRFGRRPIALFGVVLYGLSSLVGAYAQEFEILQLARMFQGLAACSTSIVVFSAVRDCFDGKQSVTMYSYLNGAICVIPALAPTFGGLLSLQFGWRSTFIFMAIFAAIVLLYVGFKFPETRPANTDSSGKLYRLGRYTPMLIDGHFMFYASSCMIAMASIVCYVSYSPMWLIGHLGISELTFSGLFGLNATINIIACFAAPILVKRIGNRPSVIVALSLMVTAALLEVVMQFIGPEQGLGAGLSFMLPMMLLCVGFAILLGPATTMALSSFGERAGTATAILGCMQMTGASIITALIQLTSIPAPFAVALVMGGGCGVLLLIMTMKKLNHWHQEKHA